jgi:hypothetical protein
MMLKLRSSLLTAAVLVAPLFFGVLLLPNIAIGQSRLPACPNDRPESSWNNCQGSNTSSIGNKYVGEYKDGRPNGQGIITFPDGKKYIGEVKDGTANGQGTVIYPNEDKYVGELKDGKSNGHGTFTFTNGNKYVGEFKDGNFNGRAIVTFADGEKYVGEYKNGLKNGKGTETYANGDKYVGEFKDGKSNGHGTFTFTNGEKYVGDFKDDKRHGHGTLTFANGQKYVGEFKDDKKNGQGSSYAADGSIIYMGIWADNKFIGKVADQQTIRMEESGGVYVVPVRFNNSITLNAIIDSGAADVSIPADIVLTLMRTKTVTQQDFLGQQTYVLADGSKVPSQQFRIRSLKVGNKTVENVTASIASVSAEILLGQSFLSKFKSWSVDNEKHVLILR